MCVIIFCYVYETVVYIILLMLNNNLCSLGEMCTASGNSVTTSFEVYTHLKGCSLKDSFLPLCTFQSNCACVSGGIVVCPTFGSTPLEYK